MISATFASVVHTQRNRASQAGYGQLEVVDGVLGRGDGVGVVGWRGTVVVLLMSVGAAQDPVGPAPATTARAPVEVTRGPFKSVQINVGVAKADV